jgi:hypothetical protein
LQNGLSLLLRFVAVILSHCGLRFLNSSSVLIYCPVFRDHYTPRSDAACPPGLSRS